jgi:hypothetical protein
MEVPVYKEDKSLTFWLRLPVKYPPVLSMKPWVEVLNPLEQLIRTLGNMSFILRAILTRLGRFLPSIAFSLAPDPSL